MLPKEFFSDSLENIFFRLLAGENLDLYDYGVSRSFEIIAAKLLAEVPARRYHWFDGVVNLAATRRKASQIVFSGEMWVGDDKAQWKEPFRAVITDKRSTKQGIWLRLEIGDVRAEADLAEICG